MITSSWRLLLPLGLLGSFALAENLVDPVKPAPPEEREVWVPTAELKSILSKYPHAVMLSREQYRTLLRDARQITPEAPDLPQAAALKSANYQAHVTGSVLTVTAQFTVQLLTKDWTEVPLDFGGALIGSVQVESEGALEPPASSGRPGKSDVAPWLLLRGEGERTVQVEFTLPVDAKSGISSCATKLPTAAVSSFHLTLPPNQRVESNQPIRLEQTPAATRVTATVAPSYPSLNLTWRGAGDSGRMLTPLVKAQGVYTIDPQKISTLYEFDLRTEHGDLPVNLRIPLPADAQVLQVTGDEVARWTIAEGRLQIALAPGQRSRLFFSLRLESPSLNGAASAQANLPMPQIEGFPRMEGTLTVLRDAEVLVKKVTSDDAVQDAGLANEAGANAVGVYRFFAAPKAVQASIEKVRPSFSADLDTQVEFKSDAIYLERTLTLHPEEGRVFQAALTVPREEELLTVRTANGAEPDWHLENGKMRLSWADQATIPVFKIRTRVEPEKWTQPDPEGIVFPLGDVHIDGAKKVTGYIALEVSDAFRLEVEPSETLERRDGRATPVHGGYAWFRRGDFSLRVKVAKRPAEVQSVLTGYALPLEGILDVHAQMDFQFLHGGTRAVRIRVPADLAQNFYFDGPQIAERNLANNVWTITFQKELTGAYALKITAQIPVTQTGSRAPTNGDPKATGESRFGVDVPVITPLDVSRSSGHWAIEANTETEISFESKSMNEIDSLLAPKLADYQPRHRVIGVFSWLGGDYSLSLSGVRHAAAQAITSVVDQLDLDTVVSTSGAERSEARFELRTAGTQYLDVRLPAKSRLLSLSIDDEMIKPVGDRPDFVRVQLPAKRDASNSLGVVLLYETPQSEWRSSGGYEARAPKLASDIPILHSRWRLFLPEGFEYTGFQTNLTAPEPMTVRPLVLCPLSIWDEWRVEHVTAILQSSGISDPRAVDRNVPPSVLAEARRRAGLIPEPGHLYETADELRLEGKAGPANFKQLFIEAQNFYDTGRFALALKRLNQVLSVEPNNVAAQRFKEKIERAMADYGVAGFNETRADFARSVDMAWARPIRRIETPNREAEEARQRKMEQIILPKIEFREATLTEAIAFLNRKSVELDSESPAGKKGVNIVVRPGAESPDARITIALTNVPLVEALRYVTGLAGLKFWVDPTEVAVVPPDAQHGELITKEYRIRPDLIPGTTPDNSHPDAIKEWLVSNGLTFQGAASATYNYATGRMVVRNTQDELDLIDGIIQSGGTSNPPPAGEPVAQFAGVDPRIQSLQRRLERIIIPKLELREATLREALDFLRQKSVQLDDSSPAGDPGVNLILNLGPRPAGIPPADQLPIPGVPNGPGLDAPSSEPKPVPVLSNPADARITVSLTNIPLIEALRYVTGLANLKFKVEPYGVLINPATVNTDVLVTKEWRLPLSLFPDFNPDQPADREVAKKMLEAQGAAFFGSASAIFIHSVGRQKMAIGTGASSATLPEMGRLIVRNTQDQLDLIDTIVASALSSTPNSRAQDFESKDQRISGLLPIKLELPKTGRLVVLEGLAAADHAAFHYDDWWSRARRLWLWFVAGGFACFFFAGRAPWWRTAWVTLLLTFFPLVVDADAMAICNALLGGWVLGLVLIRVAARLVFAPARKEALA